MNSSTSVGQIQMGTAIDMMRRYGFLPISNYRAKVRFREENSKCSIVTFYNNGRHLYFDPEFSPPDTFYVYPWARVPYNEFKNPRLILASRQKLFDGRVNDVVGFQHLGHDLCRNVTIRVGNMRDIFGRDTVPTHKFSIPEGWVAYVAVRFFSYRNRMLVVQPLPHTITGSSRLVLRASGF